jgi:NADPH-dependent curcumin reductase CurA
MATYRRIVLASRPTGAAGPANFRLEDVPVPTCGEGQVLVRNRWLSLDPYMRARMNDTKSYAAPQPVGETMIGGTAGEVVESRHPRFAVGDRVVGMLGWAEMGLSDGTMLTRVDTQRVPLEAYLGPVGMPGVTAWVGLRRIIEPKSGETVVVSAASGAVGSVVGQLARTSGCRTVGIAGGPEKCAYVVDELGFDACIDYRTATRDGALDERELGRLLKAAAPAGVDGYFENVGGPTLDAVLARMNPFGRIALCGMIGGYGDGGYQGTPLPLRQPQLILLSRLKLQGFIVTEYPDAWPPALAELGAAVADGRLKWRATVVDGLENAPAAFFSLLRGGNLGKQLVRLG